MTILPEGTAGRVLAFDSGIGGLSVVRELRALLPHATIDYLADNALFPYGELPDAVLIARVSALVNAAIDRLRPDVVVIACNTASTVALEALRERFAMPFVGCVPPIKWAADISRSRHIGLLATPATVRRAYLRDLQSRFAPDCTLIAHGAGGLADVAEAAFRRADIDHDAIRRHLDALFGQEGGDRIDVVGIGCTHYSFLLEPLRALSPPGVTWLDPAGAVARRTQTILGTLRTAGNAEAETATGRAWFTGPPDDPVRLRAGMSAYGYDEILPFDCAGLSA